MKNLMTLIIFAFALTARSGCDPKELRRLDNRYTVLENITYIERREKERTIYRGIATTRGEALELAFKDIKEKKCPDKIGY
jgi:hypothetical protein